MASYRSASSSETVSMRILVVGRSAWISRVASIPDCPGIRTSISTTSGMSSWAFCTASWPSAASPATSTSGSCRRTISIPRRNRAWSSTIRMRSFSDSRPGWTSVSHPPSGAEGAVTRPGELVPDRSARIVVDRSGRGADPASCSGGLAADAQPGEQLLQGSVEVGAVSSGPEHLPGARERTVEPLEAARARASRGGDLDLELPGAGREPGDLGELRLGAPAELVGDGDLPAPHHEVHRPSLLPVSGILESCTGKRADLR